MCPRVCPPPPHRAALADIASAVALRRIELVPQLKDFDRRKEGFVSKDQFLRVLGNEGLLPTDAAVTAALVKKLAGATDRTALVDYRSFIAIVDPRVGTCSVAV